jgi:protein TonB
MTKEVGLRPEILNVRNPITDLRASRTDEHAVAEPIRLDRCDVVLHSSAGTGPAAVDTAGNVVPFALKHSAQGAPALILTAADTWRPALAGSHGRARLAALLTASLLAHGAVYAAFDQTPAPLTSIGEVAISVEIVLGSEHAAGLAETPTETEAPDSTASAASREAAAANSVEEPPVKKAEQAPEPEPVKEPPRIEPVPPEPKLAAFIEPPRPPEPKPPVEEKAEEPKPVLEQAKPPELKTEEPPVAELAVEQTKAVEEKPAELRTAAIPPPEPEPVKPPEPVKAAEPVAAAPEKPAEIPPPAPEQQAKPVQQQPAPARQPDRSKETPSRAANASVASTSSSGSGRGRSDIDSNYRGLVAAHLARHKRFPEEIRRRRQQGSTLVTFAIDGSGKVTTVALAKSSGNASIDDASQEMIRRASPFPAPPNRQGVSFSVPVSFEIR